MLEGVQDDEELDKELDKKEAELQRKLKNLLRENAQIEREKAKAQRSHDRLEQQVGKLQVVTILSSILTETAVPAPTTSRYEEMRRRKDRKEGKLKHNQDKLPKVATQIPDDEKQKIVMK